MSTTDVGLLRYLTSNGQDFLPIGFTPEESEAEGQFILDLKEEVLSNGIESIVPKYPPLVGFFVNVHKHDSNISIAMFEILHHGLQALNHDITAAGGNLRNLPPEKIEQWGKPLGIIFFLFYKCYETFGSLVLAAENEPDDSVRPASRGKKAIKQKSSSACYTFWYEWEIRLLEQMKEVIAHPFRTVLWEEADANFLGFLVSACSSAIRHTPDNVMIDQKYFDSVVCLVGNLWNVHQLEPEIVRAFSTAVEKSDESMRLVTRIIKELAKKFELIHVCFKILQKACGTGRQSAAKYTIAEKPLAQFIMEVTDMSPELMCPALPILKNILFCDSPPLRSAVMVSAGSILGYSKSDDSKTLRKHLLGLLLTHMNDNNILVRAKVTSVLIKLIDEKKLHVCEQTQALNAVSRKINDKAPSVRKAAVAFFRSIGNENPVLSKFTIASIDEKMRKHLQNLFTSMVSAAEDIEVALKYVSLKFIEEVKSKDFDFGRTRLPEEMDSADRVLDYVRIQLEEKLYWNACEALHYSSLKFGGQEFFDQLNSSAAKYCSVFKKALNLSFTIEETLTIDAGEIGLSERTIHEQTRVAYYKDIKKLKAAFDSSLPSFCRVLEIGTPNDRKDSINLFAGYCQEGFIPSPELANSLMSALGKADEKLASDLLDSFFKIFLPGLTAGSGNIAERLVKLVATMTQENKEKMITLFQEMFKCRITNACVQQLWAIYKGDNVKFASAAVYLLGVKGTSSDKFIRDWVESFMEIGLGDKGLQNYTLATATCSALLTMYERCAKKDPDGLPEDHLLFEKLEHFIGHGLSSADETTSDHSFCEFADVAIRVIYYMCNNPLVIIAEIIYVMSQSVFAPDFVSNPVVEEGKVLRYVALSEVIIDCHVYFYEAIVMQEIKKRKQLIEQKKSEKNRPVEMGPPQKSAAELRAQARKNQPKKGVSFGRSVAENINNSYANGDASLIQNGDSSRRRGTTTRKSIISTSDAADNEMEEMVGAGDREMERIRDYLDSLMSEGFMAQIRLHVMHLCKRIHELSHSTQVASIGLLTKVMCVNIQGMHSTKEFFLELWEKTECPFLKVELIKSALYINMRFPNQMELCNKAILNGLKYDDVKLRIATLDFIIYLCLSEVIKVREYLIASSICLNDVHIPIRDSVQDFFQKMAEKNNIVFNSLPEIITFLSREDLPQDEYQQAMKFLLTKVKKPSQLAGFVDKLVSRFKQLEAGRPRQDVAYCLSILPYNDKTFKVIEDNFSIYCDKLEDGLVFDAFAQILSNAKKNCTQELKITLERYEENLNKWKENCDNRIDNEKSAAQSVSTLKQPEKSKKTPRRQRRRRVSSDEDDNSRMDVDDVADAAAANEVEKENTKMPASHSTSRRSNGRRLPRRLKIEHNESAQDTQEESQPETLKPSSVQEGGGFIKNEVEDPDSSFEDMDEAMDIDVQLESAPSSEVSSLSDPESE